jgi:hypothetical protein
MGLFFIHAPVDRRNLLHPATTLGVFKVEDGFLRPVEVVSNEGYLLV